MAGDSLVSAFLGSLQASVSVLLTVSYGVVASQFQILHESSRKDISRLCVLFFLPALLISNLGEQLEPGVVARYVPILIWSILYILLSMGLGWIATKFLELPSWALPAVAFNNTTSLPLLLVQSLDATGILSGLLMSESDSTSLAVQRAKSYFLVTSMVSNSLTFALGPKLLNGSEASSGNRNSKPADDSREDVEDGRAPSNGDTSDAGDADDAEAATEHTSLLPDRLVDSGAQMGHDSHTFAARHWAKLSPRVQDAFKFLYAFVNAPLIGAVIGAVVGLSPPLHRAFFNQTQDGGIFRAWLTSSIQNLGELFAALQLMVVGSKLASSLRKMKRGEDSGKVPLLPTILILSVRFILWPLVSIPFIWLIASKTTLLGDDPMLWFCMMLMPTGPPAIILSSLAEVSGTSEDETLSIAKFLTIAYALSPLICFSVTGSLNAAKAARP